VKNKAIIIGGGIAGLTAASILAKNGLDVTVVEQASAVGGFSRYLTDKIGYHCNVGTDILSGFGYGEVFHWLFRELKLGDPLAEGGIVEPISTPLQLLLPKHRINILSKREDMAAELGREFPGHTTDILSIYDKMDSLEEIIFNAIPERHPYSMLDHYDTNKNSPILQSNRRMKALFNAERPLSKIIGQQPKEIKDFFSIQNFPIMGQNSHDIPLTTSSVLIGRTKRGVYKIRGGYGTLVDKLRDSIISLGGKIVTNTKCDNLIIRKNRACGIVGREGDSPIELESNYVLASLPFYQINSKLLPSGSLSNYLAKKGRPPKRETLVPFTLFIGVDSKVIPEPMMERVLLQDSEDQSKILHIYLNRDNDTKHAPTGKRTLTVTSWTPIIEGEEVSQENKNLKAEEIISRLEGSLPFLSKHIDSYSIVDHESYKSISGKDGVSKYIGERHLYKLPKLRAKTPIGGLYSIDDSAPLFHSSACTAKAAIHAAETLLKSL